LTEAMPQHHLGSRRGSTLEADEKKCPQCAETVKAEAKLCRFCGHSFENQVSSNRGGLPPPNKSKGRGKGCLIAFGILGALGIIGSLLSSGERTAPSSKMMASENESGNTSVGTDSSASAGRVTSSAEEPASAPSVGVFGPQANAARTAKQYLDMTGFSRRGLIQQLSSGAGNGYNVTDATAAVDSLTVDWNEQAVRSAKQYLSMTGFSCSGLTKQLSSDAGSKYTEAQARYGAQQAGAC